MPRSSSCMVKYRSRTGRYEEATDSRSQALALTGQRPPAAFGLHQRGEALPAQTPHLLGACGNPIDRSLADVDSSEDLAVFTNVNLDVLVHNADAVRNVQADLMCRHA